MTAENPTFPSPDMEIIPLDPYYRLGVGMMIINEQKKIFIAKRIDIRNETPDDHSWQMPQGGVDHGEPPYQAALRELHEEIGTDKVSLIAQSSEWIRYDLPEHLANKLWGGRYLGQKQRWYLFQYEGNDSDFNLETKHPEFCDWKWESPERLPELVVYFKRKLYERVLEEFSDYLYSS